jgi:hypothetical protein
MYEMQGPHGRRTNATCRFLSCHTLRCATIRFADRATPGCPSLAQTLGVAPGWLAIQLVNEFLLPGRGRAQGLPLTFSRFFCHPQDTDCCPPKLLFIHSLSTGMCTACDMNRMVQRLSSAAPGLPGRRRDVRPRAARGRSGSAARRRHGCGRPG